MYLKDLIELLESKDPNWKVERGFWHPHSYRGFYDELAFEPAYDIAIGDMLNAARSAVGTTFTGWKGGEFTMNEWTECWLAQQGSTGEQLGPTVVGYMLAGAPNRADICKAADHERLLKRLGQIYAAAGGDLHGQSPLDWAKEAKDPGFYALRMVQDMKE